MKIEDGNDIPQIGLGTWRISGKDNVRKVIRAAIKNGYRHIDTALVYENEEDIGNALTELYSDKIIKREEIFITSKVWNSYHERPEEGLKKTLSDLKTDYLDLYLIHWPVNFDYDEDGNTKRDENGDPILKEFKIFPLWTKMEEFVKKGLVKSIGVSNFGIENLTKLLKECKIKPVINQFEMHPFLKQKDLCDFCESKKIKVTSYSSLGSTPGEGEPKLLSNEILQTIAKQRKVNVSCIVLSWLVQKGIIVIPKASSEEHLIENLSVITLTKTEIDQIEKIDISHRYADFVNFGNDRFK